MSCAIQRVASSSSIPTPGEPYFSLPTFSYSQIPLSAFQREMRLGLYLLSAIHSEPAASKASAAGLTSLFLRHGPAYPFPASPKVRVSRPEARS